MKRLSIVAALLGLLVISWWAGCSNPNLAGGKLHFDQASRLEDPAEKTARFKRALETFRMAVQQLPRSGEARLWLGRTYAELDMADSAAANFEKAEQLAPVMQNDIQLVRESYFSRKYNMGLASSKAAEKAKAQQNAKEATDGYREALGYFQTAAVYAPKRPDVYVAIGKMYFNLADVNNAVSNFKHAQVLAPTDPKTLGVLHSVYMDQGDKAYQDGGTKIQQSDSTGARASFERAAEFYAKADTLLPGSSDLSFQRGATAYELAQLVPEKKSAYLAEAVSRYEDVLKQNPVDVDVLYNLALVYRDLQRFPEARDAATRLVDLKPRDGTYREILGRIENALDKNNKQALITGVIFGRALKTGSPVAADDAKAHADKYPGSDLKKRYLENGKPEQILSFQDTAGQEYEAWFYWQRGVAYGFQNGSEKASSQFAPDGVLKVTKSEVVTNGTSKVVSGTVANEGNRKYKYLRVELNLYNEANEEVGRVHGFTESLLPRGSWNFEIPIEGEYAATAVKATSASLLGY